MARGSMLSIMVAAAAAFLAAPAQAAAPTEVEVYANARVSRVVRAPIMSGFFAVFHIVSAQVPGRGEVTFYTLSMRREDSLPAVGDVCDINAGYGTIGGRWEMEPMPDPFLWITRMQCGQVVHIDGLK